MERKEFDNWVDHYQENGSLEPPKSLFDYDSWKGKFMLAKMMVHEKDYEPALRLTETVLKEINADSPEDYYEDDGYNSYLEEKLWALRNLGYLFWTAKKDAATAIQYYEEAIKTGNRIDFELRFMNRGNIWVNILFILHKIGETNKAIQKAQEIIQLYENNKQYKTNSYLFNAYYFLATLEEGKNNREKSFALLDKSFDYFPNNKSEKEELFKELRKEQDLKAVFDKVEYIRSLALTHDI